MYVLQNFLQSCMYIYIYMNIYDPAVVVPCGWKAAGWWSKGEQFRPIFSYI